MQACNWTVRGLRALRVKPRACLGRSAKPLHTSANLRSSDLVSVHDEDGAHHITLNNPKKRNVLSLAMLKRLDECFESAQTNDALRCIVLSSTGPVFSSGHDLKELKIESGTAQQEEIFALCTKVMSAIEKLPVPVIAQVDGLAAAAGCQLVASCDIALASDKATFSLPGASFGLFCSTPGIPVARCVPQKVSAYMLLTGRPISAREALVSGLVSRVVPSDALQEETEQVVEAIKSKSRAVMALGKRFYYRQMRLSIVQAYAEGEKVMVDNLRYRDSQEGIAAFAEKRKPVWEHTDRKIG
ncbi:enoyl-CoA hydratase domain-containing protein 3, mitochondrial [Ixodes scapularis]|uniref:Enoyl-CoA hydratase domain-containing protein 3, mitochondrial n=2 Tax=Ixodes scapularis TaxID=6945 RepID=B7QDF3_IXOSC|nr:enoyl-CoA hydratase domain-containing protein 3, mitochondrial [Ixodes scapularis]EEC16875.1 enoyl-CoA hydratase, putative [Ixodes scapularis]|eukprot:XP_002413567.1 enoyl-CoA hydratase, putative [Ixodes scapularis]